MTAPTARQQSRPGTPPGRREGGPRPRHGRPALRLQLPSGPSPTGWRATGGAVAATALLVLFLGSGLVGIGNGLVRASTAPSTAPPPERIAYVAVAPSALPPPAAPAATPPVEEVAPPTPPPRIRDTRGAMPAPAAPPEVRDSTSRSAGRAAPVAGMPARPSPTLPLAAPSGRTEAATCEAPCADALTAGPRTGPAGLDSAGRAERLRELGASVPELASERGGRLGGNASAGPTDPGGPPAMGGISLGVGLPGGGPTKAQRARDRRLHAENMAMMARVRARVDPRVADSLRADSIARARRAAGRAPPPTR